MAFEMNKDEPLSISRCSSTLFGIHSENKAMKELKRIQNQNRKFTFLAGGTIFLLVLFLVSNLFFEIIFLTSVQFEQFCFSLGSEGGGSWHLPTEIEIIVKGKDLFLQWENAKKLKAPMYLPVPA